MVSSQFTLYFKTYTTHTLVHQSVLLVYAAKDVMLTDKKMALYQTSKDRRFVGLY